MIEKQKQYELTNHLGNVLVTLSDKKIPVDVNNDFIADYYKADIISAQDYYPFGMLQPGRQYLSPFGGAGGGYSFGYQGSLKDSEIYGNGNSYSTIFRLLDPRLGRWLSLDPKFKQCASWSSYNAMFDNPIHKNDPEGLGHHGGSVKRRKHPKHNGHIEGSFMAHILGGLQGKYTHFFHLFGKGNVDLSAGQSGGSGSTNPNAQHKEPKKPSNKTTTIVPSTGGGGSLGVTNHSSQHLVNKLSNSMQSDVNTDFQKYDQSNKDVTVVKSVLGSDIYNKVKNNLHNTLQKQFPNAKIHIVRDKNNQGPTGANGSYMYNITGTPVTIKNR